ncbi:MAG: hypothetical protein K8R31_14540 [Bacteroidales bacterium]|nr:hypothetical protein [Bacteroidales bacterium]
MKFRAKTIVKFLSLSIILSCFVFGLYAQNKYSNLIALNTKISNHKTLPKTDNKLQVKLAILEELEIVEENQKLESWMLDSKSWEIVKKFKWDEEPVEEEREIEKWMINFKVIKEACMCIDIYSDFVEKEWMKNHNFFIL